MKELKLSIGNSSIVSEGAGFLGKDIKEAQKYVDCAFGNDLTNESIFITIKEFNEKEYDEKGNSVNDIPGHLLKDIELEDEQLYRLDWHNYMNLIIISKYYEKKM